MGCQRGYSDKTLREVGLNVIVGVGGFGYSLLDMGGVLAECQRNDVGIILPLTYNM